jgi:serine/threonine-protein kinase
MSAPKDSKGSKDRESGPALSLDAVLATRLDADRTLLKPEELSLLELIDGQRSVGRLLRMSATSSFVTMWMLRSLYERGIVQSVVSAVGGSRLTGTGQVLAYRAAERSGSGPVVGGSPVSVASPSSPSEPSGPTTPREGGTLFGLAPVSVPEPPVVLAAIPAPTPVAAPVAAPEPIASPSPPAAAPAPGAFRVGPYEVATRIAQGGMGSIYLCRREGASGFRRLYTLKVVREHAIEKDVAVRSFMREARVALLMDHPNAITVADVGSYKQQPYLVLNYVEGANLSDLLVEGQPAPPALVVPVILDVLRALQRVHTVVDDQRRAVGLVHCDVSPQNVMVGLDGVARLTDFGSARFTADHEQQDATASPMGKPAYMAPEQLCGEPIDARADIFSLGVTMWTALTGQKLFADPNFEKTVINVMRKKVPPPSSFGAPACLDEICLAALDRSREGRYQTADAMSRALLSAAAAAGLVAGPREIGEWVWQAVGDTLAERRRRVEQLPPATGIQPEAPGGSRPSRPVLTNLGTTDTMMNALTPERAERRTWIIAGGAAAAATLITLIGARIFMVPGRFTPRRERSRSVDTATADAGAGPQATAAAAAASAVAPPPPPPPPPPPLLLDSPRVPPPAPRPPAPVRRRKVVSPPEPSDVPAAEPQDASLP